VADPPTPVLAPQRCAVILDLCSFAREASACRAFRSFSPYSTLRCNWPGWCDERMKAYWGTQDKRIVTTVKLEVNIAGQ
jgi:hypothetical protein